jgi:hypothetical protein
VVVDEGWRHGPFPALVRDSPTRILFAIDVCPCSYILLDTPRLLYNHHHTPPKTHTTSLTIANPVALVVFHQSQLGNEPISIISPRKRVESPPKGNMAPGRVSNANSEAESSADVSMDEAPTILARSSAFASRVSPFSLLLSLLHLRGRKSYTLVTLSKNHYSNNFTAGTPSRYARLHSMLRENQHRLYAIGSDVVYRIRTQTQTPQPAALQAIIQMDESVEPMNCN